MVLHSLSQRNPDVLSAHSDPNLLRLRSKAKVLHLHTPVAPDISGSYRRLLRRASAVVCCSAYVRERFLDITRWDPARTFVLHHGTDTERFRPASAPQKRERRRSLGIESDTFAVLYVGAITPEKGVVQLARAVRSVANRLPNVTLLAAGSAGLWAHIGGTNHEHEAYEHTVLAEGGDRLRMLGSVPHADLPSVYQAADVLVVPSVWDEPFGLVALDGLATGLPVIASRAGGLPETVRDGVNGLLVPPGDENAVAAAIMRLASDSDIRVRLGGAGREQALRSTWTACAGKLEQIYSACIAQTEHRPRNWMGGARQ
jgi:glycosyltransferase involved in cell wall biosynthesis